MLTGERTVLRPAHEGDLTLLGALRNDVELQLLLLALPRPNAPWRVQEWVRDRSSDPDGLFFVVADRESDNAQGFVQVARMQPVHRVAELAICLADDARGQGYAAEAMALAEGHVRRVFDLRKLVLHVLASNARALAFYARIGYQPVGTLRRHFYHDGQFHDVAIVEKELVGR